MAVSSGRGEIVEIIVYNCHTIAMLLWRKDNEVLPNSHSHYDACAPLTSLTEPPVPLTPLVHPSSHFPKPKCPLPPRASCVAPHPLLCQSWHWTAPPSLLPHSIGVSVSTGMIGAGMSLVWSSKLMGTLGNTYVVYNSFPGLYHPDYLSQNWVQPVIASAGAGANDVPPFAGIDNLDGDLASSSDASQKDNRNGINDSQMNASTNGDANANAYMTGHAAKCCRISTDRVSTNPRSHICICTINSLLSSLLATDFHFTEPLLASAMVQCWLEAQIMLATAPPFESPTSLFRPLFALFKPPLNNGPPHFVVV
ncbi:hypothetical protein AZE42_11509 [Rhizopogon vesiculosus]|uniref:Uncharacterized protein n=1 Tax=Rhizopogon vesiculosus TaxID=180088 RepID=A0A1J8PKZ2_9AGAM|nr:hypothetical protein AZE42_11509 [Rhizopogon vesiculosus]